ncbi:hypothetical protein KC19_VG288600 [Ceratodon purpureus]|uniref:Uncharacterized protein n=1 Tax=Ceratodon purpureus TaxID=3225 RepID=A0A8T0HUQ6_CERPU|nr:hypothetical protein KC19_VG288600 [Ceratodon purpureus]
MKTSVAVKSRRGTVSGEMKRMEIEDVQEEWIQAERAKTLRRALDDVNRSGQPGPSQVQQEQDSDYEDFFSPSDRVARNPPLDSQIQRGSGGVSMENWTVPELGEDPTPLSTLRFRHIPLILTEGESNKEGSVRRPREENSPERST